MVNRFGAAINDNTKDDMCLDKNTNTNVSQDKNETNIELNSSLGANNEKKVVVLPQSNRNINPLLQGEVNMETVLIFLKEKIAPTIFEIRLSKLIDIVKAILDPRINSKPLLLCDFKEYLPFWIASIKLAFPNSIGQSLYFKTYENKKNAAVENCLIFTSQEQGKNNVRLYTEESGEVIVFNCYKGKGPKMQYASKYSEVVLARYILSDSSFKDYEDFMKNFNISSIGEELEHSLDLYYILNNGIEDIEYTSLINGLEFMESHYTEKSLSNLYSKLISSISENNNTEEKAAFIVIKYLLKFASLLKDSSNYNLVYSYFYEYLQNILNDGNEKASERANAFYNNVKNVSDHSIAKFSEYTFSNENIERLIYYVSDRESFIAEFYLTKTLELMKTASYGFNGNSLYNEFVIVALNNLLASSTDINKIINIAKDNVEYSAKLYTLYYNILNSKDYINNEAVKGFINYIDSHLEKAEEIRLYVFNNNGYQLLLDEFKYRLSYSEDKSEFFWKYVRDIFFKIHEYRNNSFNNALLHYLEIIKTEDIHYDECYKIILLVLNGHMELDKELLTTVIEFFENGIPLGSVSEETKVRLSNIAALKAKKSIVTQGNNINLMNFGIKLEESSSLEEIQEIINNNLPDLTLLTFSKHQEFIEWCLDSLFNMSFTRINDILNFYVKTSNALEGGEDNFIIATFNENNLKYMVSVVENMETKRLQFYLIILLRYLISKYHEWQNEGLHEEFILKSVEVLSSNNKELGEIFESVINAKQYFANMYCAYFNKLVSMGNANIDFFINIVNQMGEAWANDIRYYMSKTEIGQKVLFEEFKYILQAEENSSLIFWNYYNDYFVKCNSYKEQYFDEGLKYYLDNIKDKNTYMEECLKVLDFAYTENTLISSEILLEIVKNYENLISLSYPNLQIKEVVSKIDVIKDRNNFNTTPDISGIISYGTKLQEASKQEEVLNLLSSHKLSLGDLSKARYEEFLNWAMPSISSKVNLVENIAAIKRALLVKNYSNVFFNIYNRILYNEIRSGKLKASKDKLIQLIKDMNLETKEIAAFTFSYYDNKKQIGNTKEAISLLLDILEFVGDNKAMAIRNELSQVVGGNELLFEEYLNGLALSSNPQGYFFAYSQSIFKKIVTYKKVYFSFAANELLDMVEGSENYPKVCKDFLTLLKDMEMPFDKELEHRIVSGCETILSINNSFNDQEVLVKEISEVKRLRNIKTSPDMIALVIFASKLEEVKTMEETRKLLENTKLVLDNMDILRYEEVLNYFLPKVSTCINVWNSHNLVKNLFCVEKRKAIFYTKYAGVLIDNMERDPVEACRIFAEFIIYFFNAVSQNEEELYLQVKTNLINVLYRVNAINMKNINNFLKSELTGMRNKDVIMREWDSIFNKITPTTKQEHGFFGKFRGR